MTEEELKNKHYKLCIVDADSIVYKAAASANEVEYTLLNGEGHIEGVFKSAKAYKDHQKDVASFLGIDTEEWTVSKTESTKPVEHSLKVLETLIDRIRKSVKADKHVFYVGTNDHILSGIATIQKYKGNRDNMVKPIHLDAVKKYIRSLPDVRLVDNGYETDHIVSCLAYKAFHKYHPDYQVVLASIDKDLKNTCSVHYNFDTEEWCVITPEEGDYNFALQALTGDTVDNIKGLPNVSDEFRDKYKLPKRSGVGKATAQAILQDLKGESLQTLYDRVLEAYKSFYPNPYEYTSWDGKDLSATPESILDENCTLLFMMRNRDEMWKQYKERTFTNDTI